MHIYKYSLDFDNFKHVCNVLWSYMFPPSFLSLTLFFLTHFFPINPLPLFMSFYDPLSLIKIACMRRVGESLLEQWLTIDEDGTPFPGYH